jgi:hypothetical protein
MARYRSKSGRFIALVPDNGIGSFACVATSEGVSHLASRWPCNGIPQRKEPSWGYCPIRFEFEANGDLVDMNPQLDGEAILALSQDAQAFAEKMIEKQRSKLA